MSSSYCTHAEDLSNTINLPFPNPLRLQSGCCSKRNRQVLTLLNIMCHTVSWIWSVLWISVFGVETTWELVILKSEDTKNTYWIHKWSASLVELQNLANIRWIHQLLNLPNLIRRHSSTPPAAAQQQNSSRPTAHQQRNKSKLPLMPVSLQVGLLQTQTGS